MNLSSTHFEVSTRIRRRKELLMDKSNKKQQTRGLFCNPYNKQPPYIGTGSLPEQRLEPGNAHFRPRMQQGRIESPNESTRFWEWLLGHAYAAFAVRSRRMHKQENWIDFLRY